MIKNRIFSLVLSSMLIPAAYADRICSDRHIWFGPQCIGQGGELDCSGWRIERGAYSNIDISSSDGSMRNGDIIKYCYADDKPYTLVVFLDNNITITDPRGVSLSFNVGGRDRNYISHNDISNTGGIFLNTPANGDITINGNIWGSLICDPRVLGWNCSRRGSVEDPSGLSISL